MDSIYQTNHRVLFNKGTQRIIFIYPLLIYFVHISQFLLYIPSSILITSSFSISLDRLVVSLPEGVWKIASELDVHDSMITALTELLEEKGQLNPEE